MSSNWSSGGPIYIYDPNYMDLPYLKHVVQIRAYTICAIWTTFTKTFLPRELCSARYCCRPAAAAGRPSGFCDLMRLNDFIDFISVERVKEKTTT